MVVLIFGVKWPDMLLVQLNDGHFDGFGNMNEDRMQLRGVSILHFSFLLVVNVHLLFRQVNIPLFSSLIPFSLSTRMTRNIYLLPVFMARWMALLMVVVYSLMGSMPI